MGINSGRAQILSVFQLTQGYDAGASPGDMMPLKEKFFNLIQVEG